MREIFFRGKRVDNGKWTEGFPIIYSNGVCVICNEYVRNENVIPETVGQYTGLTDKHGKKIFEGDIVRGIIVSRWTMGEIKCEVVYKRGSYLCREHNGNLHKLMFAKNIEVIGNIWDNPEY